VSEGPVWGRLETQDGGKERTVYFCACKQTAGAPLCDGTHNRL